MIPDVMVTPNRWLPTGEAVVESEGPRPLVVWSGIPGEKAFVRVDHRGRNRSYAHFLNADSPNPHRIEPSCPRYALCGGCPLMHLTPPGQEAARRTMVGEALAAVGLSDVVVGAWHDSPDGLVDFRHVIKVGFGYSDRGSQRVGAWGRRDGKIVPIPKCEVALPVLRQTMISLAHHSMEQRIRPWDARTERGVLRAAILRASRSTGEVLVTLIAGRRVRELTDLAEELGSGVTAVAGVWLHVNSEPSNALFSPDEEGEIRFVPLVGKDTIEETLGGVTYSIGSGDFFQTNPAVAEVLYQRTLQRLELTQDVPVVDLYCGVGGMALQAARHAGWVLGVEESDGAIRRARDAARRNGLSAEFVVGKVIDVLPDLAKRLDNAHPVVVVNPARRGLEEGVVEGILALKPRRIAYVSCNPTALARDLVALAEGGYRIGEIELFDMFPNTAHVECLVTLEATEPVPSSARAPRRKVVRK